MNQMDTCCHHFCIRIFWEFSASTIKQEKTKHKGLKTNKKIILLIGDMMIFLENLRIIRQLLEKLLGLKRI